MVERVEEVGAYLNPTIFSKTEVLENREVEVVDSGQLKRVARGV